MAGADPSVRQARKPLVLDNGKLRLELDPEHGAEVLDLRHHRMGPLLWRAPGNAPARHGDLQDENAWVAQYRGGWQTMFPNAGTQAEVAGAFHGFHGAASTAPWSLVRHDGRTATLAWEGHGLRIARRLELDAQCSVLRLADTVTNTGALGGRYLLGHHPTFGGALLSAPCRIDAPPGELVDLDGRGSPASPWPRAASGEDWSSVDPAARVGRFGCLRALAAGWIALRNEHSGAGVALSWPLDDLPYVWIWVDLGAMTIPPPWTDDARLVALEPVTAARGDGLAAAIGAGQACALAPGESRSHALALTVFKAQAPVVGVAPEGEVLTG